MEKEFKGIALLVTTLEEELQYVHDEYSKLHQELDKHRGRKIEDTDLPEVNSLLKSIQDKFTELYPALNFIAIRNEYATNLVNHYSEFIGTLKKAGAQEDKPNG